MSGSQSGKETVYFDKWGWREAKYTNSELSIAGITRKENKLSIMDGDWIYSIDLGSRTGTKIKNTLLPQFIEAAKKKGLSMTELGEEMLSNMGGQKVGTEQVAGKTCDVWETKGLGSKSCVWRGVTLKTQRKPGPKSESTAPERGDRITENLRMKNLIATLTIVIAFSLVQAQTYDWAITSQRTPVDEGNAVRIDSQENARHAGRFSISPFAEMRLTVVSSFAEDKQVLLNSKLIASDAVNGASIGNSVAISGDTAVIGAWQNNIGAKRAQGSVYVFVRKDNGWIEQAKLLAADGALRDYFGQSVAIDGDTIVVGVPQADIGQDKDQGAVYVFTRQGGHWAQQLKLTATGGASTDVFGKSVGISGDTIIVGAPGTDNTPKEKIRPANGAAYIFTRNNSVWTEKQKLTIDSPSSVGFGLNVAIDNKTAVVSQASDLQTSDAIYVFTNEGTGWKPEAKISSPGDADERVHSNSVSSNLAIDGNTIVVGGSQKGGKSDGAAYIYFGDNGKWTQQAKLTANDGVRGDMFGWSVDISGNTAIVGAKNGGNKGAAYLFNRKLTSTGSVWVEQHKVTANDSLMYDLFGTSVGISNDSIVIGADNHDLKNRNSNEGAAYVFSHSGSTTNSLEQSNAGTDSLRSIGRTRRVALIRNARKNGYTTRQERNAIYFQANDVEDPVTKKLVEGVKVLEYRCQANKPRLEMYLPMEFGRSKGVKVNCTVDVFRDPQIILADEPTPGSN